MCEECVRRSRRGRQTRHCHCCFFMLRQGTASHRRAQEKKKCSRMWEKSLNVRSNMCEQAARRQRMRGRREISSKLIHHQNILIWVKWPVRAKCRIKVLEKHFPILPRPLHKWWRDDTLAKTHSLISRARLKTWKFLSAFTAAAPHQLMSTLASS